MPRLHHRAQRTGRRRDVRHRAADGRGARTPALTSRRDSPAAPGRGAGVPAHLHPARIAPRARGASVLQSVLRPRSLLLGALVAVVVAASGLWARQRLQREVERELAAELGAVLDTATNGLLGFMENCERLAGVIAESPEVRAVAVPALALAGSAPRARRRSPARSRRISPRVSSRASSSPTSAVPCSPPPARSDTWAIGYRRRCCPSRRDAPGPPHRRTPVSRSRRPRAGARRGADPRRAGHPGTAARPPAVHGVAAGGTRGSHRRNVRVRSQGAHDLDQPVPPAFAGRGAAGTRRGRQRAPRRAARPQRRSDHGLSVGGPPPRPAAHGDGGRRHRRSRRFSASWRIATTGACRWWARGAGSTIATSASRRRSMPRRRSSRCTRWSASSPPSSRCWRWRARAWWRARPSPSARGCAPPAPSTRRAASANT